MLAPLRVEFGVPENVTRELQRNHAIHVAEARRHVFEVAHPDVVLQRILLQPVPGRGARAPVAGKITLADAQQFVEQRNRTQHIGRIRAHARALDATIARHAANWPGRVYGALLGFCGIVIAFGRWP